MVHRAAVCTNSLPIITTSACDIADTIGNAHHHALRWARQIIEVKTF